MPRLLKRILTSRLLPTSHLRSTTTHHYDIKTKPNPHPTLTQLQTQTLTSSIVEDLLHRSSNASAPEIHWNLLRRIGSYPNPERAPLVGGTLAPDSSIVEAVLERWSESKCESIIGLRFFIWAGTQPGQRYSSPLFRRAVRLLGIDRRPETLIDVLEAYRNEGCLVTAKTFRFILILGGEAKLPEEALKVLRKMGEFGCRAENFHYNIVIKLFIEKGDLNVGLKLMNEMDLIDLSPDLLTYVTMIKGLCSAGRLDDANRLFELMPSHGCSPNVVAYSALLHGMCKAGSLDKGMELLDEMEKGGVGCAAPDVVTYTSVIQNLCRVNRVAEALSVLDRMRQRGCLPNLLTVYVLVKVLCRAGRVHGAYKLIDEVVSLGSVGRDECYSTLIVCLAKNSNMGEAENLFRKMLVSGMKPDGFSCSVVMKQLCINGRFLDAFKEIENFGSSISIESDIYVLLLTGLRQKSHFREAAKLTNIMMDKGIRLKSP